MPQFVRLVGMLIGTQVIAFSSHLVMEGHPDYVLGVSLGTGLLILSALFPMFIAMDKRGQELDTKQED